MITVQLGNRELGNQQQRIQPTIFPDGTSQVWQLDLSGYDQQPVNIVWQFEHEAELIWVNQLITLLVAEGVTIGNLFVPYLPYARQDKAVSNTTTFAKQVFLSMLMSANVGKVTTLDAHSADQVVVSYSPAPYIAQAIQAFAPTVLVFPDASAYKRYSNMVDTTTFNIIVLDKVRNQETGVISELSLDRTHTSAAFILPNTQAQKMLIIDDICDGGATFIHAALFLHTHYRAELALYVTHGIFSKGFDPLVAAGITDFYTTQSLIKNVTGFALEAI